MFDIKKMRLRDAHDPNRVATPLELLFDLVYVVGIATTVTSLHHSLLEQQHIGDGIYHFILAFFLLWNAWASFTWFASCYDSDDLYYRLAAFVQMLGSLMIAVGVSQLFEHGSLTIVVAGYTIIRLALMSQWLRIYRDEPARKTVAKRYLIGTAIVQSLWILRLFFTPGLKVLTLFLLIAAELLMTRWIHEGKTNHWNPHHIAERYGLLAIIVLGEGVLGAINTINVLYSHHIYDHWLDIFFVSAGVMGLIFALWWLYFDTPFAKMLEKRTEHKYVFLFNYGHFFIFAALTSVGTGLELVADSLNDPAQLSPSYTMLCLNAAIAVYLVALTYLQILMQYRLPHALLILASSLGLLVLSHIAVYNGLSIIVGVWLDIVVLIFMIGFFNRNRHHQFGGAASS
ncbi:low temperature requirement protein A [Cardiobacteriaceae bacterium TAE3-ERU3]|nr:low temperature requirement protein A [Cardiobacteriaceae bacterium TAE3-ERU3]